MCIVVTRNKLKEYQDTYAKAMAKYGLKRGIEGSKAKHISTSEYYKELVRKNENLKEEIKNLETQQQQSKRIYQD